MYGVRPNWRQSGNQGLLINEVGESIAQLIGSRVDVYGYRGVGLYHYTGDYNQDYKDSEGHRDANDHPIFPWENGNVYLGKDWWIGKDILSEMSDWLAQGNYLIVAGVLHQLKDHTCSCMADKEIDYPLKNYVEHWVVIKEINGDMVTIINPYYNKPETYSWSGVLKGTMQKTGNSVIRIIPK